MKAVFRDFSLCFTHHRTLFAKSANVSIAPTTATTGKASDKGSTGGKGDKGGSGGFDSLKLNEFKYLVDEDNIDTFKSTVLPFFGSGSGSGSKTNTAAASALDGICIPTGFRSNQAAPPEDILSMLESSKGLLYHATSLFSSTLGVDSNAKMRGAAPKATPLTESLMTLPKVCGADLSKCRIAILLGATTHTSALPFQLLSLRGVNTVVSLSPLIDIKNTTVVRKFAEKLLQTVTESSTGGGSKSAGNNGKWIQEVWYTEQVCEKTTIVGLRANLCYVELINFFFFFSFFFFSFLKDFLEVSIIISFLLLITYINLSLSFIVWP